MLFGSIDYNTGRNCYAKFCSERKIVPLPLTEKNLCEYMANLAQGDVKRQSIKCYLPAARHLQIMSGQGDPFREKMPLLEDVLWGIKSEQAKRFPTAQRVQLPITPDVLLQFIRCGSGIASILITLCSGQHEPPASLGSSGRGKLLFHCSRILT